VLGQGGHGFVVRAEHEFLRRRVAIKLLHPDIGDDDDLMRRMTSEARVLASMEHPNVVAVLDGGITADVPGRPYFVMEELRGKPLWQMLRTLPNGLGLAPSIQVVLGVLDGLDFAHSQFGVIHRDIKPGNIFLHRSATDTTVPKILDFGIAHFRRTNVARTGRKFLGTPRYMAPEQIRGETPTSQTDVYAVGLVLYECLSGLHPFRHADDVAELVHAHLSVDAVPLRDLLDGVPAELDRILMSCLAKDPKRRPPSAAAAATELRNVMERLNRERDALVRRVQHATEPTPMANLLVTTHAAASEPRIEATHDTDVGGPPAGDPSDTVPGRPPFDDVALTDPGGAPFASTEPAARRVPAREVDRNALTRQSTDPALPRGPRFDTQPTDTEPPQARGDAECTPRDETPSPKREEPAETPAIRTAPTPSRHGSETPMTTTSARTQHARTPALDAKGRSSVLPIVLGAALAGTLVIVGVLSVRGRARAANAPTGAAMSPEMPATSVPVSPVEATETASSIATEPSTSPSEPQANGSNTASATSAGPVRAPAASASSSAHAIRPEPSRRKKAVSPPAPSAIGFE
jgi:serine/threonine-protein kinase